MKILATGTGRCGTHTFAAACRHMTNYRVRLEAHMADGGPVCPEPQTIDVSAAAHIQVAALRREHPDLLVVHLIRERAACVRSLSQFRLPSGEHVIDVWGSVYLGGAPSDRTRAAEIYYDSVMAMLDATFPVRVFLRRGKEMFRKLWGDVGATGDLNAALAEWDIKHFASEAS